MTRTNSSPGMDSSVDRPMRLAEIYVASEHALQSTVSNPELWESFSSVDKFEVSKIQVLLCNCVSKLSNHAITFLV